MAARLPIPTFANLVLASAVTLFLVLAVLPQLGTIRVVTALSDSMRPAFHSGDLLVLRPADRTTIREGDVITFNAPVDGAPVVTHRVTRVLQHGSRPVLRTKGDANTAVDPWTLRVEGAQLWVVRAVVPRGGTLLQAMRHDVAHYAFTFAMPLLLVLVALRRIWSTTSEPIVPAWDDSDEWYDDAGLTEDGDDGDAWWDAPPLDEWSWDDDELLALDDPAAHAGARLDRMPALEAVS